jgi:spermidine/putrescine transport system substrate-binding protein
LSKKFFAVFIVLTVILCPFIYGCSEGEEEIEFFVTEDTASIDYSKYEGVTLNVYNWGEYISDGSDGSVDINAEFTKLTGIKINYTNFTSNEDMYNKIVNGGVSYDIIIPSDYMIEKLIKEELVLELNFDNIPNYKYIAPEYKNLFFDPQNAYSVPYSVGMVGLIYNTAVVTEELDSWSALWDPKYDGEILMFNNPRDAFGIAQFLLKEEGNDINSLSEQDWINAKNKLSEQKPLVKAYVMDEIFNKMESGAAAMAPYYAGDYFSMYENNPDLAFVYPKEGTNIFVDSVCIPASTKNKEAAELYINYLMDPNVALQNAYMICYASPNTAVVENEEYLEYLDELHPEAYDILYMDMSEYYGGIDVRGYYFRDLPDETLNTMNSLWNSLKIESTEESSTDFVYYFCAVVITFLLVMFIINKIKKYKREHV